MKTNGLVLRALGLAALIVGAAGSVALMFYVGRRNPSRVLMLMFFAWVLLPFAALGWAHLRLRRWPVLTRRAIYPMMILTTLGTLAIYGTVAFGPPRPQPASFFLMTPFVSLLLIGIAIAATSAIGRRPPSTREESS